MISVNNMVRKIMIVSLLDDFIFKHQHPRVTIGCILEYLSIHASSAVMPGVLIVAFSLIAMIPVPGPNILLCPPLVLTALWMIAGHKTLSMPLFICKRGVNHNVLKSIYDKNRPRLLVFERIFSSRMIWAVPQESFIIIGVVILALSFFIALPIPLPGSNLLPAVCALTIGCGLLFKDGLALLIGALSSLAIMIVMSVILYGVGKLIF